MLWDLLHTVASELRQSVEPQGKVNGFVASLLAMTVLVNHEQGSQIVICVPISTARPEGMWK